MNHVYGNIDNSYVAVGDGSSSLPFNATQFFTHLENVDADTTYHLKGHYQKNGYLQLKLYGLTTLRNIIIEAWDSDFVWRPSVREHLEYFW